MNEPEFRVTRVKCLVRVPLRLKVKLWLADKLLPKKQRRLKKELEYQLDYEFLFGQPLGKINSVTEDEKGLEVTWTPDSDTVPREETR